MKQMKEQVLQKFGQASEGGKGIKGKENHDPEKLIGMMIALMNEGYVVSKQNGIKPSQEEMLRTFDQLLSK